MTLALYTEIDGAPHRWLLHAGHNRLGRGKENHIRIAVSSISKHHALLHLDADGSLRVEDLASKNGISINGQQTSAGRLGVGDVLGVGTLELRLHEVEAQDTELALRLTPPPTPVASAPDTTTLLADDTRTAPSAWHGLDFPPDYLPGRSAPMRDLYNRLRVAAQLDLPVLVLGETGVGKEAIARTLHASSPRRDRPLLALNCAALPEDLLESELFGVGHGVATGVRRRDGLLVEADGGTVFLDEIAELPLALQAKLLRVLEDGRVRPLGGPEVEVDLRLVAATNSSLALKAEPGPDGKATFRRDLYYRLAGFVLHVPPLHQRRDDIAALVEYFLRRATRNAAGSTAGAGSKGITMGITGAALERLVAAPWPGNVRQLAHTVARLVALCPPGQPIHAQFLTDGLLEGGLVTDGLLEEPAPSTAPAATTRIDSTATFEATFDARPLASLHLDDVETQLIDEALRRAAGNRTRAAQLLGISRQALQRRLARRT